MGNSKWFDIDPRYYVYFYADGGNWNDGVDSGFSKPSGCNTNINIGLTTYIEVSNPNNIIFVNHPNHVNDCISFNRWELLDDWFTDTENKFEIVKRKNYIAKWETHHVPTDWVTTLEETCATDGVQVKTCIHCGIELDRRSIPAYGHTLELVETIQNTCTSQGLIVEKCTVCDFIKRTTTRGDHEFGDWYITSHESCFTPGYNRRDCKNCPAFEELTRNAIGSHNFGSSSIIINTNCTTDGLSQRVCQRCGLIESTTTSAPGHLMGNPIITNPTCIHAGVTRQNCTRAGCNHFVTASIPATGNHTLGAWGRITNPTCTVAGFDRRTCTTNGCNVSEDRIVAAGHVWSAWAPTTTVVCATGYQERRNCTRAGCNANELRANVRNHNWIPTEHANPTPHLCSGRTRTHHCGHSNCNGTLGHQPFGEVGQNGHNEVIVGVEGPNPCSFTAWGTRDTVRCTRCGLGRSVNARPATPHTWGTSQPVQSAATCTTPQQNRRTCTVCGMFENFNVGNALGHTLPTTWTRITNPTCLGEGLERRTCTRVVSGVSCGFSEQRTLSALGHDMGPAEILVQPTCLSSGIERRSCRRAGCIHQTLTTLPTLGGHAMSTTPVTINTPTCTTPGISRRVCTRTNCTHFVDTPLPNTDHVFTPWYPIAEPICDVTGIDRRDCLRCNSFEQIRETNPRNHIYGEWYEVRPPAAYTEGIDRQDCIFDNCDDYNLRMWPPLWGIEYIPQLGEFSFERIGGGEFIQEVRHESVLHEPIVEQFPDDGSKRRIWNGWESDGIARRDEIIYPSPLLTNLQKVVYDVQIEHNGEIFTFMPIGGGRLTQLIEYGFDSELPILESYSTCGRRKISDWEITGESISNNIIVKLIPLRDEHIVRHEVVYDIPTLNDVQFTLEHNGEIFTFSLIDSTPLVQQVEHTKNTIVPGVSLLSECGRRYFPGWDDNGENILSERIININNLNHNNINFHRVIFNAGNDAVLVRGNLEQSIEHTFSATAPIVRLEGHVFIKWIEDFSSITSQTTINALWANLKDISILRLRIDTVLRTGATHIWVNNKLKKGIVYKRSKGSWRIARP